MEWKPTSVLVLNQDDSPPKFLGIAKTGQFRHRWPVFKVPSEPEGVDKPRVLKLQLQTNVNLHLHAKVHFLCDTYCFCLLYEGRKSRKDSHSVFSQSNLQKWCRSVLILLCESGLGVIHSHQMPYHFQ